MKRIDSPNRAPSLFGDGKDGFKSAVPGVSSATELTAKWFNAVQESIVRVIDGAGIALSEADYDQFKTALQWHAAQAASGKVTQAGGAGQVAGTVKIGTAVGAKLKAEVDGVDRGNFAFETWVSQQIAALVNSSPAALDTLYELAAAMGNDANFATTMTTALSNKERKFDSGTRMLFQQTAAPVGWTKVLTYNNTALRVVSGAVTTGGTRDFTAAFVDGFVGNTILTIAQMPAHGGHLGVVAAGATGAEDPQSSPNVQSDSLGGGMPHNHTLSLDVKYVDIIIASKD